MIEFINHCFNIFLSSCSFKCVFLTLELEKDSEKAIIWWTFLLIKHNCTVATRTAA